jgi:hypothetical protein
MTVIDRIKGGLQVAGTKIVEIKDSIVNNIVQSKHEADLQVEGAIQDAQSKINTMKSAVSNISDDIRAQQHEYLFSPRYKCYQCKTGQSSRQDIT